uniref:Phenylethanolamine N-methyltransferase n=1 Tax=Neogobius melanostomus TaxID=47308 RepID=A0A8C6TJ97_9GOBI
LITFQSIGMLFLIHKIAKNELKKYSYYFQERRTEGDHLHQPLLLPPGDISGGLLIDVGSGPTLYQVLSGCEVFTPLNGQRRRLDSMRCGSPDLDTFTKALGHISKLLRPGGQLLLIGALQESFYFGGPVMIPVEQGFTLIRLEVYTLPRYMWGTDDTNNGRWCFFVKAKED